MKKVLVFLALFTGFNVYPEIVDSAVFQTPDGTQITLFGERHVPASPKDEAQVNSLFASTKEFVDKTGRPLHVMLEEPNQVSKRIQRYPKVVSSLRRMVHLEKNKKIKAENAEIRCAATMARYILSGNPVLAFQMNAKRPFGSKKLTRWQSVEGVTFNDLYNEFEEAFSKIEKIRPVDDLRAELAEFKRAYPLYGNDSIYSVTKSFDNDQRGEMHSRITGIADKILEYYLLVRALAKSRKKDVMIVAGAYHTGVLRGLLKNEACSLIDFKNKEAFASADTLSLTPHELFRIKTMYLKLLRWYIRLEKMIVANTKSLKSYITSR
jgi:hypothetical protein